MSDDDRTRFMTEKLRRPRALNWSSDFVRMNSTVGQLFPRNLSDGDSIEIRVIEPRRLEFVGMRALGLDRGQAVSTEKLHAMLWDATIAPAYGDFVPNRPLPLVLLLSTWPQPVEVAPGFISRFSITFAGPLELDELLLAVDFRWDMHDERM